MKLYVNAQDPSRATGQCGTIPASGMSQKRVFADEAHGGILRAPPAQQSNILYPTKDSTRVKENGCNTTMGRIKLSNIDLNSAYDDSEDCMENLESSNAPINLVTESPGCASWAHQDSLKSSPPQTSGSASASTQSPSTSSGEAQVFFLIISKTQARLVVLI